MDFLTGRPNHIEDYLVRSKAGGWFGWSDSSNKIYANLIVHDGSTKPTEKQCTDGLAALPGTVIVLLAAGLDEGADIITPFPPLCNNICSFV